MKILFITSTRIGDAILSTSLLRRLESAHPEARFTIASGALSAPLFEDFEKVDQLIPLKSKKYSKHWLDLWFKTVNTKWDLVVDLRGSALAFLVRTKKRLIWRSRKSNKHRVEQLSDFLKQGGYNDNDHNHIPIQFSKTHSLKEDVYMPCLWLSKERIEKHKAVIPANPITIAVAPLANWPGKEWPHSQMIQFLQMITSEGGPFPKASFAFFAAPNEQDRLKEFKSHFYAKDLVNVGNYPHLLDVATLMKQCAFFIGNDSGLMHMAASLGIPTLGLFGPSYDIFYHPWGEKAHFIRTPEEPQFLIDRADSGHEDLLMQNLTVQDVYKKTKKLAFLYGNG